MTTAIYSAVALLVVGSGMAVGASKTPKPQPPGEHCEAARAALAKGNAAKASVELKLALQDNPGDADANYLLGSLLAWQGEQDQAIVGFQRALRVDPTHPEALHNLGTMLLERGETVPAAQLLEDAVNNHPDYLPPYNSLAKAYYVAGLPQLAAATYKEVLLRDPSNRVALENLALLEEAGANELTDEAPAAGPISNPDLGEEVPPPPLTQRTFTELADTEPLMVAQVSEAEKKAAEHLKRLEEHSDTLEVEGAEPPSGVEEETPEEKGKEPGKEPPPGAGEKPPGDKGEKPGTEPPPGNGKKNLEAQAKELRELLADLPHIEVSRRADRLVLTGWTRDSWEREMLDRILAVSPPALDLTSENAGDPHRMLEIDAVIFIVIGVKNETVGFNFLRLIDMSFNYFAGSREGEVSEWTSDIVPAVKGALVDVARSGWLFVAGVDYSVNIANAAEERVAVLARPHLTTLSGTPASFLAGGEWVFEVSGLNSGDIKPYPFGTAVSVTPTLLRTPGEEGAPRVHLAVEASRSSVLEFLTAADPDESVVFDKLYATSHAVVDLDQTLIMSGLNQRESRSGRSGVPILKEIPLIKYLFSTRTEVETNTAIVILLTPRDPAFMDRRNRRSLAQFVDRREAMLEAHKGTKEDIRRYRKRYPDWYQIPPNRYASHFFLAETSEMYRTVSGADLLDEELDLHLLGEVPKGKD